MSTCSNGKRDRHRLKHQGLLRYTRVACVRFTVRGYRGELSLFWIEGYGDGLFLPFRDATCGQETYRGGRYLYDTIKGADLRVGVEEIVLDFNYAYNPSCAYNDLWACPRAVPQDVPLMICSDPVRLPWTQAERQELAAHPETRRLLEEFPAGVHFRPRGGAEDSTLLLIWTYDVSPREPIWPPVFDSWYAEVCLRGLARMIPGLAAYFGRGREARVDGGYYCKTRENRPLIGPLPVRGAYVVGALSGYGIMASQAAGELLAAHVVGGALPDYAPAFLLSRYDDPAYRALLERWDAGAGQL